MRRRSVRWRAALAASVALAPALALASVAGVLVQRHQLTQGVTAVALDHARTVSADVDRAGRGGSDAAISRIAGESTLVQILDPSGQVVAATPALSGRAPLAQVGDNTATRVSDLVSGEEDHYIVVTTPLANGGGSAVVAESLEGVDDATTSTVRLLIIGDPMLVALVAGLTYLLVGRALRPVEALRAEATVITAADQSARLPVEATGDEVERLASTLNEMLARLDVAARAQRRFVADASHELRSPIATIRTLHEVGLALPGTADWNEISADVLNESSRLEALVDDLLLLARRHPPPVKAVETIDLGALVREEVARTRRVPVDVDLCSGIIVIGHHDSLSRALRNLLDNAERHARASIRVALRAHSGAAVLSVVDDGPGIAAPDRERVFERFLRLDEARARSGGGSGLGLSIARHLVEGNGGQVHVADSDVGARLEIRLPTAAQVDSR